MNFNPFNIGLFPKNLEGTNMVVNFMQTVKIFKTPSIHKNHPKSHYQIGQQQKFMNLNQ